MFIRLNRAKLDWHIIRRSRMPEERFGRALLFDFDDKQGRLI